MIPEGSSHQKIISGIPQKTMCLTVSLEINDLFVMLAANSSFFVFFNTFPHMSVHSCTICRFCVPSCNFLYILAHVCTSISHFRTFLHIIVHSLTCSHILARSRKNDVVDRLPRNLFLTGFKHYMFVWDVRRVCIGAR